MSIRRAQDKPFDSAQGKQKITSFLWFDKEAEDAAKFYTSIFKNSSIGTISRYPKEGQEVHGMPEGTAMTVSFKLEGQDFTALNAGPHFKFNEAISFVVDCKDQEEVDYFWEKLSAVPASEQCGWLKRQVRPLVADRAEGTARDVERQRPEESRPRHASNASNEKN